MPSRNIHKIVVVLMWNTVVLTYKSTLHLYTRVVLLLVDKILCKYFETSKRLLTTTMVNILWKRRHCHLAI